MSEKSSDLVSNRRAFHDYEILDTYEAGIVLQGSEIKSLRNNGGSLAEAYVRVIDKEPLLLGCNIALYSHGNIHNHKEKRDRKLLLHKREIAKIEQALQEKGLTCVPIAIYLKNGRAKVKIGIGKGKKTFDKRHALKERDEKREMDKIKKMHG